MKKIGITGGVGSGKSLILTFLEEKYHAAVCQADLIAHQVQRPGEACYQKIIAYFGEQILAEDRTIDRGCLGKIVFADSKKLEMLNQMVHPAVNNRIRELISEEEKKETALFILEAALLTKPVYRDMLDEIWYIHVDPQTRFRRLFDSRSYSEKKTQSIMESQPSEMEFMDFCDRIIENSGEFEETKKQLETAVYEVFHEIKE